MTTTSSVSPPAARTPLADFSRCHATILTRLEELGELPALAEAARESRRIAEATLALFEPGVLEHHADEEAELFPAVERSAAPGREKAEVASMVRQLVADHRRIEDLWARVRPSLRLAARGKFADADVDAAAITELVKRYTLHARLEEEEFLPLAQAILGRNDNHLAALGSALHMRHLPQVVGYI